MGVRAPWVVVGAQLELHSTPELDPRLGCAAWVGTAAATAGIGALMASWPERSWAWTRKPRPSSILPTGSRTPRPRIPPDCFSGAPRGGEPAFQAWPERPQ